MTDSSDNGGKLNSRDPKKIAIILLVIVAVIMLALLVNNCVTGGRKEAPSDTEGSELTQDSGYAERYEAYRDYADN